MSAKVSMFAPVKVGGFRYLFLIVGWTDYLTQLKDEMMRQLDAFGADLGTSAMVLQAYKSSEQSTFDEIVAKDWPADFQRRLVDEVDPCMLVIENDFEHFDPNNDRWAAVWFADLPTYARDLPNFFHKIARVTRAGDDLFEYFKKAALEEEARDAARVGKVAKYFEIKPRVFGVSIDVGSIISDLSKKLSGSEPG
jgi:hypothetical protein